MCQPNRLLLAAVGAACLVAGCSNQPRPLSKDDLAKLAGELAQSHAADEAAIRAADQDFVKCAEAKDLDKCMSLYADDAVLLGVGSAAQVGKENIRKAIQGLISAPGLKVTVSTTSVTIAALGDLALDQGTVQVTTTDKKGKPQTSTSQYALTWKKMPDGSWKIAADTSAPVK